MIESEELGDFLHRLRNERRLKCCVDFSIMHKYGVTTICCEELWEDTIVELASEMGVDVVVRTFKR